MTVPSAATKQHLDSGTDDPRQARTELADLVDKFNTLRSHLGSSAITSGSSVLGIGTGLEAAGGSLRLSDSGVSAGSYSAASITVDAKGRVTAAESGAANQTEMEAAASNAVAATPGNVHWHPGMAKGWVNFDGTGTITIRDSYNVDSLTDHGVGNYRVTWDTPFADANYSVSCGNEVDISGNRVICGRKAGVTAQTGFLRLQCVRVSDNTEQDREFVDVQAWGSQ